MTLRQTCLAALATLALCLPARALPPGCVGEDLIEALSPDARARIEAAAAAVPYPQGNLWRATRDGQMVTILGTYHLGDPRHDAILAAVLPALDAATRLLVEAGPKEEAQLMDLVGRDPSTFLAPEGPTLADTLPAEDWARLSQAMRDRGIPPFMASRFRPWYLTMLLSIPPCAMPEMAERNGLDARLIAEAEDRGLPVEAMEPFDTALKIFDLMPAEAQIAMIRSTLALEDRATDQMTTLAAAYFRQESRLIWEFLRLVSEDLPGMTPDLVEAEFALMEEALMNARNRNWIPVIEAAAAEGPVLAAGGALHLSGDEGVLNLLARNGWALERLPLD